MSSDYLSAMPAEIIRHVCQSLEMPDLISLSKASPTLDDVIRATVCSDMHRLSVVNTVQGAVFEFTRTSSNRTTSSGSPESWREAFDLCRGVKSLSIDIARDAANTSTYVEAIERAQFPLRSMKIRIRDAESPVSTNTSVRLHRKLTSLARTYKNTLRHVEVATSDDDVIRVDLSCEQTTLYYRQKPDAANSLLNLHHQVLYPIFHGFLENRANPVVMLLIDSRSKPQLAMQNAFQLALPHSNRAQLQKLTVEFCESMADISVEEVEKMLLGHVEYHATTPNLQEFTCRLPHTTLETSHLEEWHDAICDRVRRQRKISLHTPFQTMTTPSVVKCK
ncbi:unnamed protein product [Caenorhabditis auriculariae]|uniref:F-box domain-containing protein n=1 Tax=Caenorhabditis auriculariae TaxID=2777116 RepID=A0A8S1GM08_9PELO|nr:unnamed protein product [Caenorhabditis auriculariae]